MRENSREVENAMKFVAIAWEMGMGVYLARDKYSGRASPVMAQP